MQDKNEVEIWVDGVRSAGESIAMGNNSSRTIKFQVRNLSNISPVELESCALSRDVPSVIVSEKKGDIPPKGKDTISNVIVLY